MITVSILINGQPLYTRSAVNSTKKDNLGRTIYVLDDGTQLAHLRTDGAVTLAQAMLQTIKEVK